MGSGRAERRVRKKHILLALCGLNPQVITETFYYLYGIKKIPVKEVYLITTGPGERKAKETLIDSKIFYRMCKELNAEDVKFGEDTIFLITDKRGIPLEDIRTIEDNERVAETMWSIIKDFTADENVIIHFSVAGGRKTMSIYGAIIMSLLGRKDDRLYHILVEEEESTDFYYPRKKDEEKKLHLVEIPYIKLREVFEISEEHLSFVRRIKNYQKELMKIRPSKITVNFEDKIINAGRCGEFKLSPREFFVYSLFISKRMSCSCREGCEKCFLRIDEFLQPENLNSHLSKYLRYFSDIQETVENLNKETLRELITRINRKIDRSDIFVNSLFKIQKIGRAKNYKYGLKLPRTKLTML